MKQVSGKFVLRLPPTLHQELKLNALKRGLSLNELCVVRLSQDTRFVQSNRPFAFCDRIWDKTLKHFPNAVGLVGFGSRVRGEATAASDLDLLIVLSEDIPIERSLYRWWAETIEHDLQDNCPFPVSPQFASLPVTVEHCGSLWFEVALEGIVLQENDMQLSRLFARIREAMATGKVARHFAYGQPYWVRKWDKGK